MKIKSIKLKGYQRFLSNSIGIVEIHFIDKIQFILGTNGSGKSSLLEELSPLPANSKDFSKNGLKEIILNYKNIDYVLTSDFSINRHSFIKDGEELNLGGTLTVQRDLVKIEFNISPEIHSLYIGKLKFHSLTPSQRKYWFTILSKSDYTYAFSIFSKLKENLKEYQSQYKLIQNKYIQETDKIIDTDQEESIKKLLKDIKETVDYLRDFQLKISGSMVKEQDIIDTFKSIASVSKVLIAVSKEYLKATKGEILVEDIDNAIYALEKDKYAFQSIINIREKDLSQLDEILHQIEKNEAFDLVSIVKKISSIQVEIDKLSSNSLYELFKKDSNVSLSGINTKLDLLNDIESSFLNIINDIKPDSSRENNRDNYLYKKTEVLRCKECILETDKEKIRLLSVIANYEHAKTHNATECPKCNFVWVRGYDESIYNTSIQKLSDINITKTNLDNKLTALEATIHAMEDYFTSYSSYKMLQDSYSNLNFLWKAIESTGIMYSNPLESRYIFYDIKKDLIVCKDIYSKLEEIKKIESIIEEMKTNKDYNLSNTKSKIANLQKDIIVYIDKQRLLTCNINRLKIIKNNIDSIQKTIGNLSLKIENSDSLLKEWKEMQLREQYRQYIALLEAEADIQKSRLVFIDRQKHLIESLKVEKDRLNENIVNLKILIDEISPNKGLIAKGMNSFINIFLLEINVILKKIWLYPLELLIEEVEDTESFDLDYKFKIRVNDSITVPDIQLGSSAMKEVIDLAFRIVCMKYLGMNNYPLYLDEFGHSMDSSHRNEATKLIQEIATYGNFSQIFIISHFETCYGSFRQSQINILNTSNIVIPKELIYNSHMTVT